MTYAAVLDGHVGPFQSSGSLMPTGMDSDLSEPTVSSETEYMRVSSDKSEALNEKPDGTNQTAM